MRYILTAGWDDGIADLTQRLVYQLATGKRVLWLASGGSNIDACVAVMENISAALSSNLTILPADERYGPPGHSNSNLAQLLKAGFDPAEARVIPVLKTGLSFEETAKHYSQLAKQLFKEADYIVAQLGVGEDGHILGIMPQSDAAREASRWAVADEQPPYQRLTLTFPALRHINTAFVFAFGTIKHMALQTLRDRQLPLTRQPAQVLKQLPEVYIYNDQIGD